MESQKSSNSILEPASAGKTILCVEDDHDVRQAVELQLHELGYQTIIVNDPSEAMKFILEKNINIDLLFTDIVMPGQTDGWKFAKVAKQARPKLKILYTTGFFDEGSALDEPPQTEFLLLKKPYRSAELAAMLLKAIES